VRKNTRAQQSAGTIHTDLERGFIRAEVVTYDEFVSAGSLAACRDKGTLRLEVKDYVVQDVDILNVRFNV
jgi:ribosome-binding ATPase YchF (GTP1/OBG family)